MMTLLGGWRRNQAIAGKHDQVTLTVATRGASEQRDNQPPAENQHTAFFLLFLSFPYTKTGFIYQITKRNVLLVPVRYNRKKHYTHTLNTENVTYSKNRTASLTEDFTF